MTIPDSQQYHWHLYLINNVEDIVVSRGLKVYISNNYKNSDITNTQSDKAFKGTVVIWALQFLHEGSLDR